LPSAPPQLLPELLAAHAHLAPRRASSGSVGGVPAPVTLPATGEAAGGSGGAEGEPPALAHLRGLLAWARGRQAEGVALMERAVQLRLAEAEEAPLGLDLFADLEPHRALDAVRRLLAAAGGEPRQPGEAPAPALARCVRCGLCRQPHTRI
jgi:hypothetical protein